MVLRLRKKTTNSTCVFEFYSFNHREFRKNWVGGKDETGEEQWDGMSRGVPRVYKRVVVGEGGTPYFQGTPVSGVEPHRNST